MSARLLSLRPGAVIKTHRDADLTFENGEVRIHVPIFTNPEVDFEIERELAWIPTGCGIANASAVGTYGGRG
jgi:hypothetical protein